MSEVKPHIRLEKNGPAHIENIEVLHMEHGDDIPVKNHVALCRCGKSANQPFCDGSHHSSGFRDDKQDEREKRKWYHYFGKEITVLYDHGICAHTSDCIINLMEVFNRNRQPWVEPDNASKEHVIKAVRSCPSGALRYELNRELFVDWDSPVSIKVLYNGPLVVLGHISLEDERDSRSEIPSTDHYCLCRCGQSKNMPFCDGAHLDQFYFE